MTQIRERPPEVSPIDKGTPRLPDESPIQRLGRLHLDRRGLLLAAGNTLRAAVGVLLVDSYLGEALQSSENPGIYPVESPNDHLFPDTHNIIFTGFGAMYPENLAAGLAPTFNKYGRTAFIRYGNAEIDFEALAKSIFEYVSKQHKTYYAPALRSPKTVTLYGHSMGGIVAAMVGDILKEKYGIRLGPVLLDCSPARKEDVRSAAKRALIDVLDISNRVGLHGGPILRGSLEVVDRVFEGNVSFESLADRAKKGLPGHALDNEAIQNQAGVIRGSRVGPRNAGRRILQGTRAYHLGPDEPERDGTVDIVSARDSWRQIVETLVTIDIAYTQHANPNEDSADKTRSAKENYNRALEPIFISSKLPNAAKLAELQRQYWESRRIGRWLSNLFD